MVSVVICSLLNGDKKELIQKCVGSLSGFDELILMANPVGAMGYCEAWNTAASLTKGDYIILISDDHVVLDNLKDMCVPDTVTSPIGANTGEGNFWGGMFCIPRNIYEKYGLYDMVYDEGIHYMDEDLKKRYAENGVNMSRVNVRVIHSDPGHTLNKVENFSDRANKNHNIFSERWGHA